MTLKELYEEVINSGEWKYYDSTHYFSFESLNDSKMCKVFIKKMIEAGKKNTHPLYSFIDKLEQNRLQHIVSCFFLGFIFYTKFSCVKDSINEMLEKLPFPNWETPCSRFKYVWFLICLFHDLGYAIEDNEIEAPPKKDEPKLSVTPFYMPEIYSTKNIDKYEKYREGSWGVKDHGIYGGKIFFSEMCDLRKQKERESSNRFWDIKMEEIYACAAWIIVCHNIFYIPNKKNSKHFYSYKQYELNDFLYNSFPRNITLKKHPLLFLFCLVDAIEPIKTLKDINCLDKIEVIDEDSKGVIQFVLNKSYMNGKEDLKKWKDYSKKIHVLKNWLTKVRRIKNSSYHFAIFIEDK